MTRRNFDCLDGTCGDGYGVEFSGAGGVRGDMVRAVRDVCVCLRALLMMTCREFVSHVQNHLLAGAGMI